MHYIRPQTRCKEFPHAVVAKVFCFGHSFEAAEQQAGGLDALEAGFKQHKDQLVVFPPEGDDRVALDGGVSMVRALMPYRYASCNNNGLTITCVIHPIKNRWSCTWAPCSTTWPSPSSSSSRRR